MTSPTVRDSEGFYSLPTDMFDLISIVVGGIRKADKTKLQDLLIDTPACHLSIDHLSFLPERKASVILATIELGRRAWVEPTQRLAEINNPETAYDCFSEILKGKVTEHFAILFLNAKSRLLDKSIVSIGSWTETLVPIPEILRLSLSKKASKIIMAHNHPSGSLDPSQEDLDVTQSLLLACKTIGIHMIDHLIITDDSFRSIREQGYEGMQWPF